MELLEATPIPWAQGVVSSNLAAPTNEINALQLNPSRTCVSSIRDYPFKSVESSTCEKNCVRTVSKLRDRDTTIERAEATGNMVTYPTMPSKTICRLRRRRMATLPTAHNVCRSG
jgi:hypothetical protein